MNTLKGLDNIANLHDLKSIPRTRRSAKPQLSTTAILELNMARNERDSILKQHMRLAKQKNQIDRRLAELEKEMDELLENAQKKAAEIRGESGVSAGLEGKRKDRDHPKMTLEY